MLSIADSTEALTSDSGECGESVTYDLDKSTGILTISGSGPMTDYNAYDTAPWYADREYIKTIKVEGTVSSIGNFSFYQCEALTSISITDTVTSIGKSAFEGCSTITSLTIPGSVTSITESMFKYCTGLVSVTIPDSVTSIGWQAFKGCSALTTLTIPNSVLSIETYAFDECTSLTSVTIPDSVTSLGSNAFYGCSAITAVVLGKSVESIENNTFNRCTNLTTVTINGSVKSIGSSAFEGCTSLTSITLPDSVKSIGQSAFDNCTKLASIKIPESVKTLGQYAFYDCTSLTSITIPNSITSLGDRAFYGCTNLKELTVPVTLDCVGTIENPIFLGCENISKITFTGSGAWHTYDTLNEYTPWQLSKSVLTTVVISGNTTSIEKSAFKGCSEIKELTIPANIDSIVSDEYPVFEGCVKIEKITFTGSGSWYVYDISTYENTPWQLSNSVLTTVVISDGVTSLGEYSFMSCVALSSVSLPGSITSVGEGAFSMCTALTSITIPESITTIEANAFYGCSTLATISLGNKVESIGASAFTECAALTTMIIPDSVTSLGDGAFYNCTSLKELSIPANLDCVVSTTNPVFEGCVNIEKITFTGSGNWYPYDSSCEDAPWQLSSSTLTTVIISDGITSIGASAFKDCTKLEDLSLPANLNSVGTNDSPIFEGCTNIKKITFTGSGAWYEYGAEDSLPSYYGNTPWQLSKSAVTTIVVSDGVTSIGDRAFNDCTSLTSVAIGRSVSSIGTSVFRGCTSLVSIDVSEEDTSYCSVEGVLFNKDKTTLFQYPSSKSDTAYTIPDTVRSIGDYAFSGSTHLTSITIANSVTSIGTSAFDGEFFDTDGKTELAQTAANLAGSTFKIVDGKWVKQNSPSDSDGSWMVYLIIATLIVIVLIASVAIVKKRNA